MTAPAVLLPAGAVLPPAARLARLAGDAQQARSSDAKLKLTASLYAGDHWAGGLGWSGPLPAARAREGGTALINEVERTYVSRNLLRDVVGRHQAGVAGREPLWSVVPRRSIPKGEKLNADETKDTGIFTDALTDWWEQSNVWLAVQKCIRTALWSGQGTVRLYLHRSSLDLLGDQTLGIRTGLSLSEALRRISVHAPEWDQAGAIRDRDGHVTGAYHNWTDEQGRGHLELHEKVDGGTVVHPDLAPGGTDLLAPTRYPVPDLLIYEMRLDPLVTDSIVRLGKLADKTLTMGSRNIDLGGFTERTILNAQMPKGQYVDDPESPTGKRFEPAVYNVGAGATNFLSGIAVMQRDAQGNAIPSGQFASPSIVYKDPSPYDTFKATYEAAREAIFDEAKQLHVLIAGDATTSGVSRVQAVNDFVSSLEPTRMALESLLRWLLSTVLGLGLHFTNQVQADDYRVRVQARLSAVQPTPAEVKQALDLHERGAITEESMMGRVGVEDVDAERATRTAEGITPTIALKMASLPLPAWIVVKAMSLAFPALGITDQDVKAQKELDLASGQPPVQDPTNDTGNLDPQDPNADPTLNV